MRLSKARKEIVTAVMKDTIFEAADSVLEEHGIGGMTMDRVATTAGLAAGSLYNYFRNKDELLRFVFARLVDPFFEAIDQIRDAELSAPEKLQRVLATAVKNGNEQRGLIRLLAASTQHSRVRKTTRPRMAMILSDIFQQGIREGTLRPHNPLQASRLFVGGLAELFDLQVSEASNEEITEYVRFLSDVMIAGLRDSHAETISQ